MIAVVVGRRPAGEKAHHGGAGRKKRRSFPMVGDRATSVYAAVRRWRDMRTGEGIPLGQLIDIHDDMDPRNQADHGPCP